MQVFVLERVIPPLVITFKLERSTASRQIIFPFLFNSHYLKKSVHGPGPKPFYKNKKVSMDLSMTGGPWNRSKVGVHGVLVHVFFHLDPKQSQDRVFKFKLSHRSFSCWQADLCEFGGKFCGGSAGH